jgi:hypothetical protein
MTRYRVSDPCGLLLETDSEQAAWLSANRASGGRIFDTVDQVYGKAKGGHEASAWIEWDHGTHTRSTMPFYDGSGWLGT